MQFLRDILECVSAGIVSTIWYQSNLLLELSYIGSKEITHKDDEVLRLEEVSVKVNSAAVIEKLEEEKIPKDAPIERLQEENERVFDEVTEECKANMLSLVTSPWTEGWASAHDQILVRNGIDIEVLKNIVPLPLISEKAEDSLALFKTCNEKMKTTLAGGYLIVNIKDSNPEQCDNIVVISEDAS